MTPVPLLTLTRVCVCVSVNSTTGAITVTGGLDHNEAAVTILTVRVTDANATEGTTQEDTGNAMSQLTINSNSTIIY